MIAKAVARYLRISPRKTRLVTNYIKGKPVSEALAILNSINKRACEYIEEVIRSAASNAKRDPELKEEDLYISKLVVDGGPALKRYRAGSMGRAMMIRHRTSHISVELDVIKKRRAAPAAPSRQERAERGRRTNLRRIFQKAKS